MRFLEGEYVNSSLVAGTTEELGIRTKINTTKKFVCNYYGFRICEHIPIKSSRIRSTPEFDQKSSFHRVPYTYESTFVRSSGNNSTLWIQS